MSLHTYITTLVSLARSFESTGSRKNMEGSTFVAESRDKCKT